jgi:outer membrane immunogenic protein
MMTKTIRTGAAIAALLIATIAAQAADLSQPSYKAPAYSAPGYANWTGFYVGLNGGYGFGTSTFSGGGATDSVKLKGAMFGGTLGYNYQTGTWVWGLEGDYDISMMKGTPDGCTGCEVKNTWLGTARARVGYAGWNNWMPYLTGGVAYSNIKLSVPGTDFSKSSVGYVVGAGVEYAFLGNWSTKIEYLYAALGTATCPAATCGADIDIKTQANIVRLGVNYRF